MGDWYAERMGSARPNSGDENRVSRSSRDFDRETAIHLVIMAQLVRLGVTAPHASVIAAEYRHCQKLLLLWKAVIAPGGAVPADSAEFLAALHRAWDLATDIESEIDWPADFDLRRPPIVAPFNAEQDLGELFDRWHLSPVIYAVIGIESIVQLVQEAQARWEEQIAL